MPKIITPAMRAHLDEDTTRLTAIWRITRTDGAAEPAPSPGRLLRQWPVGRRHAAVLTAPRTGRRDL